MPKTKYVPRFVHSSKLEAACEGKAIEADMTSTSGYDNDGSTGPELIENGWQLGVQCGEDQSVFWFSDGNTAYYFIGTSEEELIKAVKELPEASEDEDSEDDE
jgi:hypothetical protein